jgi:hypothetical protein
VSGKIIILLSKMRIKTVILTFLIKWMPFRLLCLAPPRIKNGSSLFASVSHLMIFGHIITVFHRSVSWFLMKPDSMDKQNVGPQIWCRIESINSIFSTSSEIQLIFNEHPSMRMAQLLSSHGHSRGQSARQDFLRLLCDSFSAASDRSESRLWADVLEH